MKAMAAATNSSFCQELIYTSRHEDWYKESVMSHEFVFLRVSFFRAGLTVIKLPPEDMVRYT